MVSSGWSGFAHAVARPINAGTSGDYHTQMSISSIALPSSLTPLQYPCHLAAGRLMRQLLRHHSLRKSRPEALNLGKERQKSRSAFCEARVARTVSARRLHSL